MRDARGSHDQGRCVRPGQVRCALVRRSDGEEFARANQGPAKAQQALVNAIRQSMGKGPGELPVWMGGSLARPEIWPRDD